MMRGGGGEGREGDM